MASAGKGSGRPPGELTPDERKAFAARVKSLGERLEEVTEDHAPAPSPSHISPATGYGLAFRFAADLVVGVALGGFIGWLLDRQFGSQPWLLVLFLVLGFAAGLANVMRTARQMQAGNAEAQRHAPSVADDDE